MASYWVHQINQRSYNALQVARALGIPLHEAIDRCFAVQATEAWQLTGCDTIIMRRRR